MKSGFVAVVGAPNAGKSTLINALMGERLLITSEKSQTTRRQLRCILTGEDYQAILVDTPGLHQPKNKLGDFMVREILSSVANSDVVLHVLDATRPAAETAAEYFQGKPTLLLLNKIDLLLPRRVQELTEHYAQQGLYQKVIPVSAHEKLNLAPVLAAIMEMLPVGEVLYPPDQLMDCDYRLLAAELIREQALLQLEDEIPHGITVEIVTFTEEAEQATITANIIVERESHKGIVIGRGGSKLGSIGASARIEIGKLLAKAVHLKLWVKVKKNWRKDANQLRWLGYK